ncbi:hypothetical protein M3147_16665 [Agromyces mediolanus]|uniref:MarR family winged helix-turn-helix transcriptional regulator n=1 Tax=Agromyces mediolanus TaxID=41986 RepID=UPI00203F1A58|nr:hypothetical protein [Agromyces mediolanus]MCM3658891.1 hypothetical protein [Agromyces mediolanus]
MTTHEDHHTPEPDEPAERNEPAEPKAGARPFGFWLKLVDRRLSEEMAELFADVGLSRHDWRALNLYAGAAEDERLAARLAERPKLAHRLAEHGWLERGELTEEGLAARERLQSRVDGFRERVAGAVSDEDFATTLRTLEAIARELGWDESQPMPRGRRGGRRFHGERGGFPHEHGHRGGFPHEHGHRDPRGERHGDHGFGHEHCGHESRDGHDERHGGRGHGRGHRREQLEVHVHLHH